MKIKKLIKSFYLKIHKVVCYLSHDTQFYSGIDLMSPVNGKFTVVQSIIISRVLDIELIRKGEKPIWHTLLKEKFSGKAIDASVISSCNSQFHNIVDSLERYGWDYNLSACAVNASPFYIYDGTHRLAYSILNNPYQVVPVKCNNNHSNWVSEEARPFWESKGLDTDKISILENSFWTFNKKYQLGYYLVFQKSRFEKIEQLVSEYFDKYNFVKESLVAKILSTSVLNALTQSSGGGYISECQCVIINFIPRNHMLVLGPNGLYDKNVKTLTSQLKGTFEYCTYSNTQSLELKLILGI